MTEQQASDLMADIEAVGDVITVRECMSIFGIKAIKTVMIAIWREQVKARKADGLEGDRGGVWLIDYQSAIRRFSKKTGD
jgi:hypothetical protein